MFFLFFVSFFCKAILGFTLEHTEEAQILKKAEQENKMILLACVGTDFCPWSQKMENEILDKESFIESLEKQAILWRVTMHAEASSSEEKWRKRWRIAHCPLLLLLDPRGKEVARFDYLPLEPQQYAHHFLGVIDDFKQLCSALQRKDKADWLTLYEKAKGFSSYAFKKALLHRAEEENPSVGVLLEKYRLLLAKQGLKHSSVKKCRKKILQLDPKDEQKTHFHIALAEFQMSVEKKESEKKVIRPLKRFIEHFGEKDPENLWRAEAEIAAYLVLKRKGLKAQRWVSRALQHAPEEEKSRLIQFLPP